MAKKKACLARLLRLHIVIVRCRGLGVAAMTVLLSLAGCGERRDLREWRPEDHQALPEGAAEAPENGASVEQAGQALFMARCSPCHGEDGRGGGPLAPPVAQLPDLTSAAFQESRTDEQLASSIRNGRGMMPPFADQVGDQGIAALVGFVRALGQPQ